MKTKNTNYHYDNPNSHFGGIIYSSDFDTNYPGNRNIARRIASDQYFDMQCRKSEEARSQKAENLFAQK